MEFLGRIFYTSGFSPRLHGGSWSERHGWLHVVSDLGMWMACVAIPCALEYLWLRRKNLPFRRIFLLFGASILACGTMHFMEATGSWRPPHRLAGLITLFTALLSWSTVLALASTMPRALAIRCRQGLDLKIEARRDAESGLQRSNDELERRVRERTEALTAANAGLQAEIADRRRVEETLRAITDNASTAIFVMDEGGRCTFMNPAAEAMTGYTFAEAEGRALRELVRPSNHDGPPESDPIGRASMEVVAARGHEGVFLRRSGEPYPVLCHARPIRRGDAPIWTVIEVRDVTDEKEAERRIYDLLSELREADRKKDDFLAMLAHELRNPLAPIRNALQILRLTDGDRDALARVRGLMERQVDQMIRLVDDLLDVSRITRNKLELRRERIALDDVVQCAVEMSRPIFDEYGHELTVEMPPEPILLDADLTRLSQVFANLLNNAAKYTEPGGHIHIAAERRGDDAVVVIQDDGIGIPAAMQTRIFELFTQGEATPGRSRGGLGIGLTLARQLVQMHGGAVEASSAGLGRGSTFAVRLPICSGRSGPSREGESGPVGVPRRRILVVDDYVDAAESLALMLRFMGHEVHTAHDGVQAVETAGAQRPEVILLDIGLPKLNGFDACRRIREQPWGSDTLIVALTGWGQDQHKRRAREAGFDHHFTKPIQPAALEGLLAELPVHA